MAGGEDKAKDAKKELESPLETGLLRVLFKAPQQQKKLQLYGEGPKPAESLELAKRRFRSLNALQEGDDLEIWLNNVDRVMLGQTLQVRMDFLLSNAPRRMAHTLEEIWREKSGDGTDPKWQDIKEILLDRELGSGRLGGALSRLQEARQGPQEPFRLWTRRLFGILETAFKREPESAEYLDYAAAKANAHTLDHIARKASKCKTLPELVREIEDWEKMTAYGYPNPFRPAEQDQGKEPITSPQSWAPQQVQALPVSSGPPHRRAAMERCGNCSQRGYGADGCQRLFIAGI